MADRNGSTNMLNAKRNEPADRRKPFQEMLLREIPGRSKANAPMHAVLEGELNENELLEGKESQNVRNRALIQYLATLANSNSTNDTFDYSFVESLINNGADVNSTDKTGQTVFHEVARSWNIDVASFLIKHGANVNHQDQYGRSPLHVAAAVDYAEMVEFLLQNKANIDIKTSGEGQTAMHYAAKNDAINAIQMLLGYGADIDARDSKNRTPLQVSAEMNRSKAAKLLITEGAPAGVYDNLGNSALSLLIEKIPEVALDAMDQFHSVDTINRKEFYFLNYLEGTKLNEQKTPARTPLEIAVQNERFDIVMHPVIQRLIGVKWNMYGKWGAILDLVINLLYAVLWTILAVTLPQNGQDLYLPPGKNSWRLIIDILLIFFTMLEIRKQVLTTVKIRHELKNWREWRAAELERDLAYCHPRWPQEAQYLKAEIKAVRNLSLISGSDWWIYFDWVALVLILATIASHITFFHYSNDTSKEVHHYIIIPLLLILWLRIFKYARPFEGAGPFVVIFGHVMSDIVKWAFLNSIIVIPFTCAFWITFGAISLNPVSGYNSVGPLLYNMFSMMVVNSHNYDKLEEANPVMARLLCGAFIGIAAIVTLNLLIALLTNTFERLYENAVANAVMQRARTILLLQKSLRKKQKDKYYEFIKSRGSPEVIVKTLGRLLAMDGDDHASIERVRDDVRIILSMLSEKFGKKFGKGKKSDLDWVKMDVSKIRRFQQELIEDVKNMKTELQEIGEKVRPINDNKTNINDMKQSLGGIIEKMGEIKNDTTQIQSIGVSIENIQQQSIREKSEDCNDSGTESSDNESGNESNATCNRRGKLQKLRTGSEHSYDTEQNKDSTKRDQASQVGPETHDALDARETYQQMAFPHQSSSIIPEMWQINSGSVLNSQTHDQTTYGNQWFTRAIPNKSMYPPHHHPIIENRGFQQRENLGQRPNNQHIPSPLNQQSSLYEMRQPAMTYFDKSSLNIHRSPIEKNTSLQSSPYTFVKQYPEKDRLLMGNADESYGYQNYGFQPTDHGTHQPMPSSYTQMVLNSPIYPNDEYGQTGRVTYPMVPHGSREQRRSQNAPTTTQNQADGVQEYQQLKHFTLLHSQNNSSFQGHFDNQQDSILRTGQLPTPSASPQAPQQNIIYKAEIPQVQIQIQPPDTINDHGEAIPKDQTTPIGTVPQKVTADRDELEASNADTSKIIPKGNLVQNVTLDVSSNKANWYDQYRVLSPVSPKVMNKVAFFEEKTGNKMPTTYVSSVSEDPQSTIPNFKPTESLNKEPILQDTSKVPLNNLNSESHSVTDEQPKTEESEENISPQETTGDYPDPPTQQSPTDFDVENQTPEEISSKSSEDEIPEPQLSTVVSSTSLNVDI